MEKNAFLQRSPVKLNLKFGYKYKNSVSNIFITITPSTSRKIRLTPVWVLNLYPTERNSIKIYVKSQKFFWSSFSSFVYSEITDRARSFAYWTCVGSLHVCTERFFATWSKNFTCVFTLRKQNSTNVREWETICNILHLLFWNWKYSVF